MEAALRFDCEIARCPVHKLDISESGSGQLQTRFQNVTEYRPKVGTAGKSRCNVRWHVPAIIRACAGPFYWPPLGGVSPRTTAVAAGRGPAPETRTIAQTSGP